MKVGYFFQEMYFENNIEMAGYIDRKLPSSGYLTPLEVHSIFLEEKEEFFINIFDLLSIPEGLPMIPIAVHTHSAPRPDCVKEQIVHYSEITGKNSKKLSSKLLFIEFGSFKTTGVCNLRTVREIKSIEGKILVFRSERQTFGVICYPCHPTVLGTENTLYSSDLAGKFREKLSSKFGFPFVFLNSYCGDVSTHKTRLSRTSSEIERLGNLFASQIELENLKIIEPRDLNFEKMSIKIAIKNISLLEVPKDPRALPGYNLAMCRENLGKYSESQIALLSIGSLKILLLPFEIFYETGLKLEKILREISNFNVVVCYALSYRPYVVPKNYSGTYEWYASPYSDEAEGEILKLVEKMVKGQKRTKNSGIVERNQYDTLDNLSGEKEKSEG